MNIDKLKKAEKNFFQMFPGGFSHPDIQKIAKKHKPEKMNALAQESFALKKFENPTKILENMVKVISTSSMISLFEKPKFKDFAKGLNDSEVEKLSVGLRDFLHGNEESGFEMLTDILQQYKLAKWSLITICPAYFRPQTEVFIKPTTVKNVIEYFEIEEIKYKPTPTYVFYKKYREIINKMKEEVDKSLSPDNAAFSGFLMMSMEYITREEK